MEKKFVKTVSAGVVFGLFCGGLSSAMAMAGPVAPPAMVCIVVTAIFIIVCTAIFVALGTMTNKEYEEAMGVSDGLGF